MGGCSKHGTRLKISQFHGARLIFTSSNCSELRKSYKQHVYLDKIIHDTCMVNFLNVSRHTPNPIETLVKETMCLLCQFSGDFSYCIGCW